MAFQCPSLEMSYLEVKFKNEIKRQVVMFSSNILCVTPTMKPFKVKPDDHSSTSVLSIIIHIINSPYNFSIQNYPQNSDRVQFGFQFSHSERCIIKHLKNTRLTELTARILYFTLRGQTSFLSSKLNRVQFFLKVFSISVTK